MHAECLIGKSEGNCQSQGLLVDGSVICIISDLKELEH
jgi:hypothetical protein